VVIPALMFLACIGSFLAGISVKVGATRERPERES
jgi:hypothetical protein